MILAIPQQLNPWLSMAYYAVGLIVASAGAYVVILPLLGKGSETARAAVRFLLGVDEALDRQTAATRAAITEQTEQLSQNINRGQQQSTQAVHDLTAVVADNQREALAALERHNSDPDAHAGHRRT